MADNHPFIEMLTSMGFDPAKSKAALTRLGENANIERLIDELSKPEPETQQTLAENPTSSEQTKVDDTPNEAGKVNPALQAAQNRAQNSSSTAITAEERARRNAEIDARANAAREARIERERQEKLERERLRRSEGKKMMEASNELDDKEAMRAKQRVIDEKREAAEARRKVKEQIEADRQARINKNKKTVEPETKKPATASSSTSIKPAPDTCRIRIQFPDGSRLQQAFKSAESFAAVRVYVEQNKEIYDRNTYQYSLTYPRKVFSWEDFEKPISQLNLGGSAVIIVEKRNQTLQEASKGEAGFVQTTKIPPPYVESPAEFDELLRKHSKLVVDFTASWCGPCKNIAPVFEQLAEKHREIQFVKVDVDKNEETAKKCGIRAMPTFHFYKNGEKVDEMQGADPNKLQYKVQHLL